LSRAAPANDEIAEVLERIASLLEAQDANPHRVRAYRRAAGTARSAAQPLAELAASADEHALEALPGIGRSLAALVREFVLTGRTPLLDRLEGQVSPEDLLTTVPGIGEELARRIHRELGVETLEELELLAHEGRLEEVPGVGPRRAAGIRDAVGGILSRSTRRRARRIDRRAGTTRGEAQQERPDVATLLAIDAEYRRRAEAGELRRIAPRRFNPRGEAWLPVLHTERDGWHVTALFSNTARAHELGTTRDWVVLFYERDGHEDQCTVVTERRGPLAGRRVVRGREAECARLAAAPAPGSRDASASKESPAPAPAPTRGVPPADA
jgi:DNA uptake protein ComE-like DNA-binding protein